MELLLVAVLMVAVFLLMPTPKMNNAKAASLNDFDIPTNSNGRAVPELFGTAKLSGNVIWYGDLRSEEIVLD